MQPFETWLKADLQAPVTVKRIDGNLFSGDNQGNLIGVTVTDAGEPATLSGEVRGYFIRSDGNTVIMSGTIDGNKVTVVLPSACYTFVGQFSLVIKVGQVAVGACTGYVYQSNTDSTVDPEHVIPDIDQLLTRVEALEGRATTLEGDVSAQNDTINAIEDGLAIIANGNVHPAIANGQFVYVKGHSSLAEGLYRATAAIGTNATLSTSNLTADGSGGLNALNADVASLNRNLANIGNDFSVTAGSSSVTINSQRCEFLKGANNVKYVWIMFTLSEAVSGVLFTGFQSIAVLNSIIPIYKVSATENAVYSMRLNTNGNGNANGSIPAGQYVAMGFYA